MRPKAKHIRHLVRRGLPPERDVPLLGPPLSDTELQVLSEELCHRAAHWMKFWKARSKSHITRRPVRHMDNVLTAHIRCGGSDRSKRRDSEQKEDLGGVEDYITAEVESRTHPITRPQSLPGRLLSDPMVQL